MEKNKELRAVLFTSRNKDNKGVENFKQRSHSFLTTRSVEELEDEFEFFVNKGVKHEKSRFYVSVNVKDEKKVLTNVQLYLLQHSEFDVTKLSNLAVKVSWGKENNLTKKWLFDFDDTEENLQEFLKDVYSYVNSETTVEVFNTYTGFAVVTSNGFNTQELLNKWKDVELKRDAFLFHKLKQKS